MKYIKIKPRYIDKVCIKNEYAIIDTTISQEVGNITFKIVNHKLIIGFLGINNPYKKQGYGTAVIDYLLSHYKIDCIIGETLYEARTFWNKMIRKYNGQRHNISACSTCSSSFVIPKYKISNEQLYKLLNLSLDI